MKKKQVLIAIVLAFAMVFTITPVKANADGYDNLSFHLKSGGRLWDFVTDKADSYLFGLYEPGNYFMLEYADGTEDEFDFVEAGYDEFGEWKYEGFYPDGDRYFEPLEIIVEKTFSYGAVDYGPNWARLAFYYKGKYYDTAVPFRGVYPVYGKLSKKTYYYDGKVHTPTLKMYVDDGYNTPISSSDYSYKWESGRKNVGEYSVHIVMKNLDKHDYPDETYETFTINPPKPKITKLYRGKKSFTVKWKKFTSAQQKQITRFRIEYSTDKNFKKGVKKVYASKKSSSKTIKKLKSKKTYYVRVCAYKNISTEGYIDTYQSRSSAKKVKTR